MAVSAAEVKVLRDQTGAGLMDCKRALQEAGGDLEKAKDILRRQGLAKSRKREGRATGEGCVAIAVADDLSRAVVLELNCETDFVGRTDDFRSLTQELADQALQSGAEDAEALDAGDLLNEAVSRIGEAVRVGRIVHWQAAEGGVMGHYLHTATHRVAALVELGVDGADPADLSEELAELGRDLGMQIAAMQPVCVDRDGVPADMLEREQENLRQAQDLAGKPPQIQEKIIAGRLQKGFYQQVCLLDQEFARGTEESVREHIAETAKRVGATLTVRRFARVEVGRD